MPSTCVERNTRDAPPMLAAIEATRPSSHGGAVAACYVGLVLIVGVGVLLDRLIWSPLAATLFVVLVLGLAVWLHPTLARRGRRRNRRRT